MKFIIIEVDYFIYYFKGVVMVNWEDKKRPLRIIPKVLI